MLRAACDNRAKVFLNGELVLTNPDWILPTQAEVTTKLRPGRNELLVDAANKGGAAVFVPSHTMSMADGSERKILTDASWLATAPGRNDWKPAKVVAGYGAKPWGDVFNRTRGPKLKRDIAAASTEVIQPADIHTLPGFRVELIHTVPKAEQGSWVGLTVDDRGILIATDQYGGLYRLTPPHVASLYRLRDTKGTGRFDEKTLLREIEGHVEHGNHSLVLAPDGQSIYVACGNGTRQPVPFAQCFGVSPRSGNKAGWLAGFEKPLSGYFGLCRNS